MLPSPPGEQGGACEISCRDEAMQSNCALHVLSVRRRNELPQAGLNPGRAAYRAGALHACSCSCCVFLSCPPPPALAGSTRWTTQPGSDVTRLNSCRSNAPFGSIWYLCAGRELCWTSCLSCLSLSLPSTFCIQYHTYMYVYSGTFREYSPHSDMAHIMNINKLVNQLLVN